MPLSLAGHSIEAFSVAGFQTCIELPELSIAFDMGFCPRSAVKRATVLVSHGHMDHVASIAQHAATRGLLGMDPPTYFVPEENRAAVDELFAAYARLDDFEHVRTVHGVAPGDERPLGKDLVLRAFRSPHRVPCVGYAIWRRFTKLRADLHGLSSEEIGRLVRQGEAVSVAAEAPEIVYTGDTLVDVVEREEVVRKARLLIMELTFVLDDVDVAGARARGHTHLDEIAARADLFENEAILFTHFSARYTAKEIVDALDRKLPAKLRARVTPLLTGHP
jgi:ribonuclease Z